MKPDSSIDATADFLSPELAERLAEILEAYLADLEAGRRPDPERLVAEHPEFSGRLRASLEGLQFLHRATAEISEPVLAGPGMAEPAGKRLGDYVIEREIGRGGMGIVYQARQISLDRPVALKVLPLAGLLDPKQITRFQKEARAAAQLHHPNIVPIFSVGCERGVHYYAMQYIEGQSLDAAIDDALEAQLTGIAPAGSTIRLLSTSGRPNERFRAVAELGAHAAEALHHAHQYGIIHRDVKPSNLLLDQEGKIWVTDFGLARFQADAGLTGTGDVVGTLRYMSPEQAAGKAALVDERSDVYSLGVTLYELLALAPAFEGGERAQLFARIANEEPRRLRRVEPAIPVDLETIVHKAIAKPRELRYNTAQELADDLWRFLDGRPTIARRPSLATRAALWARRHRAAVSWAAALLVVLVVGLVAASLVLFQEHGRTKEALARAEAHYRQARQAVDQLGMWPSEQLASLPGAEPVRRELLQQTLGYYEQFLRDAGNDPTLRADLARAQMKIGAIHGQLGARDKTLAAYRQAEAMLRPLAEEDPRSPRYAAELGLCLNNLGLTLGQAGDTVSARAAFREAIATLARQVDLPQADRAQARADLALAHSNMAILENQSGRLAEAEREYRAAVSIQQDLVEQNPDEARHKAALALSYANLGFLYAKTNPGKACRSCRDAIEIFEPLVAAQPTMLAWQADLALAYNNLGLLESQAGQAGGATQAYGEAIKLGRQLVRRAPAVSRFRRDLAVSLNNLGRAESDHNHAAGAQAAYEEARTLLEELLADDPAELNCRSNLGGVLNNLARVYEHLGRTDEALSTYRRAIEHQRFAVAQAPGTARFREFLAQHYANYARALTAAGKSAEAAAARQARDRLLPSAPLTP